MKNNDLSLDIKKLIQKELTYHKTYIGKVLDLNDPQKKGRICVGILDLACFTADIGFWCWSRDKKSLITPKLNDWVCVGFVAGNRDIPYYFGIANEMADMLPKDYDGKNTTQIIYEADDQWVIKYDESTKKFVMGNNFTVKIDDNANTLTLGKGNYYFVLGDNLMTFINTSITTYNTHIHPTPAGPSSATISTLTAPSNILSSTIKGE